MSLPDFDVLTALSVADGGRMQITALAAQIGWEPARDTPGGNTTAEPDSPSRTPLRCSRPPPAGNKALVIQERSTHPATKGLRFGSAGRSDPLWTHRIGGPIGLRNRRRPLVQGVRARS
jgi:hypothetical protein